MLKTSQSRAEEIFAEGSKLEDAGRYGAALGLYSEALNVDPDYGLVHAARAMLNLRLGDFTAGLPEYEWVWNDPSEIQTFPEWMGKPWKGESLNGKALYLWNAQGLGDCIQMIRYVPLLREKLGVFGRLGVSIPDPLKPLWPMLDYVTDTHSAQYDYHCLLMSLPHRFGTRLHTIPAIDLLGVTGWEFQPVPWGRVGLAWFGNKEHTDDARRSIPFGTFRRIILGHDPHLEFASLQNELREIDTPMLENSRVRPFQVVREDMRDVVDVINTCDLVITVDTSIAHLAGTMGVPVWVLLPFNPDWRWMTESVAGPVSPWYPTMRLFRQQSPGDWSEVIDRVYKELRLMGLKPG